MENHQGIPHITCEHLQKIKTDGSTAHVVVDLRDPVEYDAGHIEGSVNVPRRELQTNIETIVPHKSHKIVVVVGPTHEPEIKFIFNELKELGYQEVEFLAGGFDKWCEISDPSVEDVTDELTPEEMGQGVRPNEETEENSYEGKDSEEGNEPLM